MTELPRYNLNEEEDDESIRKSEFEMFPSDG